MYENIIHECSSSIGEKIEDIKIGLKNYDSHSYESFTKLYNCVINGLEFNPLVNSDVIKNYKDIFVNHTHMFFKNPDKFKAIFAKYDPKDLVRCLEKNGAIIEKL